MKSDAATTIVMAGVTLYFIGCVELFTNWNSHHKIEAIYKKEQKSLASGLVWKKDNFGRDRLVSHS
jgi:imidazoleglycerol phosphate dehydratase HisB